MNKFEVKQEWIEAVMADKTLTPATARYAFGIYKHMYGKKDEAFPGAKALAESTGLNDSQFYRYNQALKDAGYLEVTSTEGRSNTYRLLLPTSDEGRYLPPQRVGVPQERVGGTSIEGTNTTKKTVIKTTMENNKQSPVPNGPVDQEVKDEYEYLGTLKSEDFEDFSLTKENLSFDYLANADGVVAFTPSLDYVVEDSPQSLVETHEWDSRTAKDWREIRKQRPLTKDEHEYINAKSRAYKAQQETAQAVESEKETW